MSDVTAERIFRTAEGMPVVARIYAPEKSDQRSEWSCRIEVQGLEAPFEQSALGIDSFQALYLGLRLLCVHLDKITATLTFSEGKAGECDTPLVMPWPSSPSLKAEVYELIIGKMK